MPFTFSKFQEYLRRGGHIFPMGINKIKLTRVPRNSNTFWK